MSCLYFSLIYPVWLLLCLCGVFFPLYFPVSLFLSPSFKTLPLHLSNILNPFTHTPPPPNVCVCNSLLPLPSVFIFLSFCICFMCLCMCFPLFRLPPYPFSFSSKLMLAHQTPQADSSDSFLLCFGIVFIPTCDRNSVIVAFAVHCTQFMTK